METASLLLRGHHLQRADSASHPRSTTAIRLQAVARPAAIRNGLFWRLGLSTLLLILLRRCWVACTDGHPPPSVSTQPVCKRHREQESQCLFCLSRRLVTRCCIGGLLGRDQAEAGHQMLPRGPLRKPAPRRSGTRNVPHSPKLHGS